jgi:type I site-specific restriction endonuclease
MDVRSEENLLSFTGSSSRDHGSSVLNLVLQAAEIFGGMEATVKETEARAQSIRKSSDEKVRLAEKRIQVAERARREVTDHAERKLHDASKALKQAQARITAAEDLVTALEFRAQSAEAQLHDARQTLLQVEQAIRERFLNEKLASVGTQHDLAV